MTRRVAGFVALTCAAEPVTEEGEAEAVLLALAGHDCSQCSRRLTRTNGYVCCATAYCPLCGGSAEGPDCCGHQVARRRNNVSFWSRKGTPLPLPFQPANGWRTVISLRCAELAGQMVLDFGEVPGQSLPASVHVKPGDADFRALKRHLLETCLLPDVRTAHADAQGRYTYHFFSRDPEAARARVRHVAAQMRKKQ